MAAAALLPAGALLLSAEPAREAPAELVETPVRPARRDVVGEHLERRLTLLGREAAGLTDEVIRKAHQRLAEGLFAVQVKQFHHRGQVVQGPPQIDWTERREAAAEILKIADQYPNRLDVEVTGDIVLTLIGLSMEDV